MLSRDFRLPWTEDHKSTNFLTQKSIIYGVCKLDDPGLQFEGQGWQYGHHTEEICEMWSLWFYLHGAQPSLNNRSDKVLLLTSKVTGWHGRNLRHLARCERWRESAVRNSSVNVTQTCFQAWGTYGIINAESFLHAQILKQFNNSITLLRSLYGTCKTHDMKL
jgi:hypothetical protein